MSNYTFEGTGAPVLEFNDGQKYELSEPNGVERNDLRTVDFNESVLDSYWSEADTFIEIGKKFIFAGTLRWKTISKQDVRALQKAQAASSFYIILNSDRQGVKYKVKGILRTGLFEGLLNSEGAYTATFEMRGVEKLDKPGYGALNSEGGFGTSHGTNHGID